MQDSAVQGIEKCNASGMSLSRAKFLKLGGAVFSGAVLGGLIKPMDAEASTVAKFEPDNGYMYTGVSLTRPKDFTAESAKREWNKWTDLMRGKPAAISHEYTWFDNWTDHAFDWAKVRKATPMISLEFTNASTKQIAMGGVASDGTPTDALILRHARTTRNHGGKAFIRLGHEMNGHWYPYCAYNANGSPRKNTTKDYIDAWRRVVIIFRGGYVGDINRELNKYDLPSLNSRSQPPDWMGYPPLSNSNSYLPPVNNAAFVWCPNISSIPDIKGNAPERYYPGDGFVDWVGQDAYYAPWWDSIESLMKRMNDFYYTYSIKHNKPYMLAEWGLRPSKMSPTKRTKNDTPSFINRVLSWAKKKKKVKALVYWSWDYPSEGDYRLSKFPDSAEELADGWRSARFLSRVD